MNKQQDCQNSVHRRNKIKMISVKFPAEENPFCKEKHVSAVFIDVNTTLWPCRLCWASQEKMSIFPFKHRLLLFFWSKWPDLLTVKQEQVCFSLLKWDFLDFYCKKTTNKSTSFIQITGWKSWKCKHLTL